MFEVDPEAVRAAARSFAATAEHLGIAGTYHRRSSDLDLAAKGMILELKNTHDVFVALFQERLDQASTNLQQSAVELGKAGVAYGNTDLESASRLDASLSAAVDLAAALDGDLKPARSLKAGGSDGR